MYRAVLDTHTPTRATVRGGQGAGAFRVAVAALQTLYRPREPRGTGVPRGREGPPRAAGRSPAPRARSARLRAVY